MMNLTRGEDFTIEVSLDTEPQELESLDVRVVQNGRCVMHRRKAAAVFDDDGACACFTFTGGATLRLRAGEPAFAQARSVSAGGAANSEVEEICVLDTLAAEKEKPWN